MVPAPKTATNVRDIKIQDVDFKAVEECGEGRVCKRYIELLHEDGGHYPDLLNACKEKLWKLDKKLYYSVYSSHATPEEESQAREDILNWEEGVKQTDSNFKALSTSTRGSIAAPIRGVESHAPRRAAPISTENKKCLPVSDKKYARDEQSVDQYYRNWDAVDVDAVDKEIEEKEEARRREMQEEQAKNRPTFNYESRDVSGLPAFQREHLGNAEKEKGNEAFYAGDFDEALTYFTKALDYIPKEPSVWANRALTKLRKGDLVGAEEDCLSALSLDRNYCKALYRLGKIHYEQGRFEEAYEDFKKAQRLEPYNSHINADLLKVKRKVQPKGNRVVIEESSDEETEATKCTNKDDETSTGMPGKIDEEARAPPGLENEKPTGFKRMQIEEEEEEEKPGFKRIQIEEEVEEPSGFKRMQIEEDSEEEEEKPGLKRVQIEEEGEKPSGFKRLQIEEDSEDETKTSPANFTRMQIEEDSEEEEDETKTSPANFTRMQIEEDSEDDEPPPKSKPVLEIQTSGFQRMEIEESSEEEVEPQHHSFQPPPRKQCDFEEQYFQQHTVEAVEKAKIRANELFTNRKVDDSIRLFTVILDCIEKFSIRVTAPTLSILHSNRAMAYLHQADYRKVIDDCTKAITYNHENTKAFFRRATAYCELHDFKAAKCNADIVVQRGADVGELMKKISHGLKRREVEEQVKKARQEQDRLTRKDSQDEELTRQDAELTRRSEEDEELIRQDEELTRKEMERDASNSNFSDIDCSEPLEGSAPTTDDDGYVVVTPPSGGGIRPVPLLTQIKREKDVANELFAQGHIVEAEAKFTECLNLAQSAPIDSSLHSVLYSNRAFTFLKQKKWEAADIDCTRSLDLDPTNVKALYRRAWARSALGYFQDALEDCNEVERLTNKEMPEVALIRARIQRDREPVTDADWVPVEASPNRRLGGGFSGSNPITSSPRNVANNRSPRTSSPTPSSGSTARDPYPDLKVTCDVNGVEEAKKRGNAAFTNGETHTAVCWFTKAIWNVRQYAKNYPPTAQSVLWSNRALAHIQLEEWLRAVEDAKRSVELDPKNQKGYYRLAQAQLNMNQLKDALSSISQMIELSDNVQAQTLKAEILSRMQQAKRLRMENSIDAVQIQPRIPNRPPGNTYEFQKHMNGLRNKPELVASYLTACVAPTLVSQLFSQSEMDTDTLVLVIEALHFAREKNLMAAEQITSYVNNLLRMKNAHITFKMFSSREEKRWNDLRQLS